MLRYFHNRPSDGSTASGYIVLDPTTQLRALSERAFAILTDKCSYNLVAETPVRRAVGGGGGQGQKTYIHGRSVVLSFLKKILHHAGGSADVAGEAYARVNTGQST